MAKPGSYVYWCASAHWEPVAATMAGGNVDGALGEVLSWRNITYPKISSIQLGYR